MRQLFTTILVAALSTSFATAAVVDKTLSRGEQTGSGYEWTISDLKRTAATFPAMIQTAVTNNNYVITTKQSSDYTYEFADFDTYFAEPLTQTEVSFTLKADIPSGDNVLTVGPLELTIGESGIIFNMKQAGATSYEQKYKSATYTSGTSLTLNAKFDKTNKKFSYSLVSGTSTLSEFADGALDLSKLNKIAIEHITGSSQTTCTYTLESLNIHTTTSYATAEPYFTKIEIHGEEGTEWTTEDLNDWIVDNGYTLNGSKSIDENGLKLSGGNPINGNGFRYYHNVEIPAEATKVDAEFVWMPGSAPSGANALEFGGVSLEVSEDNVFSIDGTPTDLAYSANDKLYISMVTNLETNNVYICYSLSADEVSPDKKIEKTIPSDYNKIVLAYYVKEQTTKALTGSQTLISYKIGSSNANTYILNYVDEENNAIKERETMYGTVYSKIDLSFLADEPIYTEDAVYTFKESSDPDAIVPADGLPEINAIYTKSTEANYTVKYYFGSTEIKEAAERTGTIGTTVELDAADTQEIKVGDKTYVFDNTDAATQTIKSNGSTVVSVNFLEKTTAVEQISTDKKKGQIYSLDGRPVNRPNRKGLYVQDGKLVIL